jgi:outer membrane lipoprotein LolB
MMRTLLMVAALALLAACTTKPQRISADSALLEAQAEREAALARQGAWKLTGRLAVSDGRDGGSGRIEWIQDGDAYQITLNAPVTRQSWRLAGDTSFARLDGLEGGPFFGEDAESLLMEHVGWKVPFSDLIAWMRGARASGPADMEFGENGLPALIVQRGWRIEYRAFSLATLPLPTKVFAEQGERKVRMQVDRWETAR